MYHFLDSTCKWYHMLLVFLWLPSLSKISSRSFHVAANGIISFFLWLSNIPLCIYIHNGILYIHIHCVYIYIYHIFFIHSSVDGHLGCFHVLAIVNSAAVNIGVHVSFRIIVFSGYIPRSGISGPYGSSIFVFWGTTILFSTVAAPIYIPPTVLPSCWLSLSSFDCSMLHGWDPGWR